jgi:hypothetical protein
MMWRRESGKALSVTADERENGLHIFYYNSIIDENNGRRAESGRSEKSVLRVLAGYGGRRCYGRTGGKEIL